MPPNSEIEKLERRWRENPKGTVFAPYAEVLRKNGDHELAREVLRQGLELHPDHIPGNIVLGRCSLDLGEDGPAETAFTHVLGLDSENVIAIKALADITERHGRLAEANGWLARLISVDPSNDEARDQLARVAGAQEAAAALTTDFTRAEAEPSPPPLPAEPRPSTVKTREIEIIPRPSTPGPMVEPTDRAESSTGVIYELGPSPVDEGADAAFDRLIPAPPEHHIISEADARTIPLLPILPVEPETIEDLEPMELDIAAAARDLSPAPLADFELDELFAPPVTSSPLEPATARWDPDGLSFGVENRGPIDLRPADTSEFQTPDASNELLDLTPASSGSEFQAPDASNELLDLTPTDTGEFQAPDASYELLDLSPTGNSEFQEPDASQEFASLSGSASSEYQTPNGVDDLLARTQRDKPVENEEAQSITKSWTPWDEEKPGDEIAALAAMPTEELSTSPWFSIDVPAVPDTPEPEPVELADDAAAPEPDEASDWIFEEEALAGASLRWQPAEDDDLAEALEAEGGPIAEISERVADAYAEAEAAATGDLVSDAAAEGGVTAEAAPLEGTREEEPHRGDLKLIFPDDAATPAPHQVRRLTQEVDLPAIAEEAEPTPGEPEPVLTETMAELYARQGHTADALRVYRALSERQPHDPHLRERIAELESRAPTPARRLTYAAVETGGESVESFFRSLAESRPGGGGASWTGTGHIPDDDGSGAPTRPARDPLSLSAIFGEEPAVAAAARTPAGPLAPAPTAPAGNSFSFDQFFGGLSPAGGSGGPRPESASEEDLDQFQHWLKSLKK